jgi:hypothetical protein
MMTEALTVTEYQYNEIRRVSSEVGLPLHRGMHRLACILSEINIPFTVIPARYTDFQNITHTHINRVVWEFGGITDYLLAFDKNGELIQGSESSTYLQANPSHTPAATVQEIPGTTGEPAFIIKFSDRYPAPAEIIYFA